MMWSNLFGRFSLKHECVGFWVEGGFLNCMNTSLSHLSLLCSLSLSLCGEIGANHKQSNFEKSLRDRKETLLPMSRRLGRKNNIRKKIPGFNLT